MELKPNFDKLRKISKKENPSPKKKDFKKIDTLGSFFRMSLNMTANLVISSTNIKMTEKKLIEKITV